MAVLAECPICHRKQSNKNKKCKCGEDLDQAKRSKRVKYWIKYRLPGGKQRKEFVGKSIEDARAADGKRKRQKKVVLYFTIKRSPKRKIKQKGNRVGCVNTCG